jgi:uncharacterized protein (TIGR03437 family)
MSHMMLRLALLSLAWVPMAFAQITITSVTNAASFEAGSLSPGSIGAIFGTGLATTAAEAGSIPIPFSLAGATVTVNGVKAPLFYASPVQINFQIPFETQTGTASIAVSVGSASSAAFSALVELASPGIFQFGTNRAVAQNPDYSLNDSATPVAGGSYITAYLTGLGPLNNSVADGAAALLLPLSSATSTFSATVGGQPANVFFLGLAPGFVGLAQANITIPSLPAGNYPLVITVDGIPSNGPLISVSGSTSTAPRFSLISTVATPIAPRNVAINGTTAYVCGGQAIDVVDISSPANPKVLSTIGQSDLNNGSGIYCALLGNSLIEIVNTQTLVVYDVTTPTAPLKLAGFTPPFAFSGTVFFAGTTGFLTTASFSYNTSTNSIFAQQGEFYAYDFSKPSQPVFDSNLQPGSQAGSGDASPRFGGVAVNNQTAFIVSTTSTGGNTSGGAAQVQVIDIGNPASMQAIGQVLIPQAAVATAIAVEGTTALVSGNTAGWRNPGLPNFDFTGVVTFTALDLSDPRNPSIISTLVTNISSSYGALIAPLGNGYFAVSIQPPADNTNGSPVGSGQLGVVDATNPKDLKIITMDSAPGLNGLAIAGSNLYSVVANGLNVYQITN